MNEDERDAWLDEQANIGQEIAEREADEMAERYS